MLFLNQLDILEYQAESLLQTIRKAPEAEDFGVILDDIASAIEGLHLYSQHTGLHPACPDAVQLMRDALDCVDEQCKIKLRR